MKNFLRCSCCQNVNGLNIAISIAASLSMLTCAYIATQAEVDPEGNASVSANHLVALDVIQEESKQEKAKPDSVLDDQESVSMNVEKNLASYDQVWSTIKEMHWDVDLVGEKWDAAHQKIRPQVENAKTMQEVRQAMEDLIHELGQSHFGIIPADSYEVVSEETGGDGYSGIDFRLIDDHAVVARVAKGSPAESAGVEVGWTLVKVGKRTAEELIKKFSKAASGPMRRETIAGLAMSRVASGAVGDAKAFVFKDHKGQEQKIDLKFGTPPGKLSKFGNLPEMRVDFETKTLEGGVGYFRFNMFFDPARVMKAYNNAIQNDDHQNGFVIDLRGNIGGIGGMTMGMARPFAKEKTKLGTMLMRKNKLNFAVFPTGERYSAPVAVIVDECSISSAEILSGGLQDIGAAKVFGQRTAGLALPSTVVRLPNGDGFQYAVANYLSEKGKSLEMDGVSPDFPVKLTAEGLAKDNDPVLTAALRWISQQSKPNASND